MFFFNLYRNLSTQNIENITHNEIKLSMLIFGIFFAFVSWIIAVKIFDADFFAIKYDPMVTYYNITILIIWTIYLIMQMMIFYNNYSFFFVISTSLLIMIDMLLIAVVISYYEDKVQLTRFSKIMIMSITFKFFAFLFFNILINPLLSAIIYMVGYFLYLIILIYFTCTIDDNYMLLQLKLSNVQ